MHWTIVRRWGARLCRIAAPCDWLWERLDDWVCDGRAVIEGMDLVYQIEGQGSQSGTPKKTVTIRKSGELEKTASS